MRILILIFVLCVFTESNAQRGIRRFRPFRNNQAEAAEDEAVEEPKQEEVQPKPQRPSRGSGRSRRLFPARFPGSPQQEDKLEVTNNVEPAVPPPQPRRQSSRRRRPQLPKRLTTTTTTTVAPEITEDIIDEVDAIVEEIIAQEEAITSSTTPAAVAKPKPRLRSPVIRNRPILRPSRRNQGKSKPKPKQEEKVQEEMEKKSAAPKPLLSRHRFSRPGFRGRAPAAKEEPKQTEEVAVKEEKKPSAPRTPSRRRQPLRLRGNNRTAKKEEKVMPAKAEKVMPAKAEKVMPAEAEKEPEPKKKSPKFKIPEITKTKPKKHTRIRQPEVKSEAAMTNEKTAMKEKKLMPVKEEKMPMKKEEMPMEEKLMPEMREFNLRIKIDKTKDMPEMIKEEVIIPVPVSPPRINLSKVPKEMLDAVPLPMLTKSRQLDIPLPEASDFVIPDIPELADFPQEIERSVPEGTTEDPIDTVQESTDVPLLETIETTSEHVLLTTARKIIELNLDTTSKPMDKDKVMPDKKTEIKEIEPVISTTETTIQVTEPEYEYYEVIEYLDYIEGQDEPIITVKERKIPSPKENTDIIEESIVKQSLTDSSTQKNPTKDFEDFTDYDTVNEKVSTTTEKTPTTTEISINIPEIPEKIKPDVFASILEPATADDSKLNSPIMDLQESESKASSSKHPNKLPQETDYYDLYEYYDYPEVDYEIKTGESLTSKKLQGVDNKESSTVSKKQTEKQKKDTEKPVLPQRFNRKPNIIDNEKSVQKPKSSRKESNIANRQNRKNRLNRKSNIPDEEPIIQKPRINRKQSKFEEKPLSNPRINRKPNNLDEEPVQKPRINRKQNILPDEPNEKPRIRKPKEHLEKSNLFGTELIGTVENTPEEEVFEILSGLGSRRRGLSMQ